MPLKDEEKKKYNCEYYLKNNGYLIKYHKKYYLEHKEEILNRVKNYVQANKDKISFKKKVKYKQDYFMNPEKYKKRSKIWLRENPWYSALKRRIGIQHLKERTPKWADMEKIKAYYEEARFLTKTTGKRYTVDHIVPLCGETVCGLHVENNLQIMLGSDNFKKRNYFDFTRPTAPTSPSGIGLKP